MNKENLKRISVWLLVFLLFILIVFSAVIFAVYIELKAKNTELRNENEKIYNELMDAKYDVSKLNPCPMCDSEDVKLLGNDSFHIYCDNFSSDGGGDGCGLRTGYYDSKVELIETWNSIPRE